MRDLCDDEHDADEGLQGRAAELTGKVIEPDRAILQVPQDRALPLAADDAHTAFDRAGLGTGVDHGLAAARSQFDPRFDCLHGY